MEFLWGFESFGLHNMPSTLKMQYIYFYCETNKKQDKKNIKLECEVWWAALSWQVCCSAIFFTFFNNGFNGAPWDVQSFTYFL